MWLKSRFLRKCLGTSQNRVYSVDLTEKKGPWSVLFFGTDHFSLQSLVKLENEYRSSRLINRLEIVTAYKGNENAVSNFAKQQKIKIHQWPVSFSLSDFHIGVVVSFGYLIPTKIIQAFPLGMLNVHASLLPRWRGAAPVIYSLLHGDTSTGVTIMRITPKRFDVGEVLAQKSLEVHPDDTQPILHEKLAQMGANLLVETLSRLPEVLNSGKAQSEANVTHAPKITREISIVKWNKMTANDVYNLQRALTGIYTLVTTFRGTRMKIFDIKLYPRRPQTTGITHITPGLVLYSKRHNLILVQCSDGNWVSIKELSLPNRRKLSAHDFRNGFMKNNEKIVFETIV